MSEAAVKRFLASVGLIAVSCQPLPTTTLVPITFDRPPIKSLSQIKAEQDAGILTDYSRWRGSPVADSGYVVGPSRPGWGESWAAYKQAQTERAAQRHMLNKMFKRHGLSDQTAD
jgi:hypothetical protein